MRWTADRPPGALAALALVLSACTSQPVPSATPDEPGPTAPIVASGSAAAATPSPSPSPSDANHAWLPVPGRPLEPDDVLDAMRTSTRPDGVPAQLQTREVAAAIAARIWTIDGGAPDTLVVSATCGRTCSVEVAAGRDGTVAEDLWVLAVDPATAAVEVVSTELRAVAPNLVARLDSMGRGLRPMPAKVLLTTVTWRPPPDTDLFGLAYRSGGEEGSCAIDLLVDAREGTLVDSRSVGC